MITAKMNNDKYIELSPGWPYEVEWYRDGKIKLTVNPRIYPATDFQLQRNGVDISYEELNRRQKAKGLLEATIMVLILLAAVVALDLMNVGL